MSRFTRIVIAFEFVAFYFGKRFARMPMWQRGALAVAVVAAAAVAFSFFLA